MKVIEKNLTEQEKNTKVEKNKNKSI